MLQHVTGVLLAVAMYRGDPYLFEFVYSWDCYFLGLFVRFDKFSREIPGGTSSVL